MRDYRRFIVVRVRLGKSVSSEEEAACYSHISNLLPFCCLVYKPPGKKKTRLPKRSCCEKIPILFNSCPSPVIKTQNQSKSVTKWKGRNRGIVENIEEWLQKRGKKNAI